MERFKVNRAPFKEALEHVRSIVLYTYLVGWVYRSRGEQAKAALPMPESRLTERRALRLRYSDFWPGTCHGVKRAKTSGADCRVQAIAEKACPFELP
jgi:hypothetical protein